MVKISLIVPLNIKDDEMLQTIKKFPLIDNYKPTNVEITANKSICGKYLLIELELT